MPDGHDDFPRQGTIARRASEEVFGAVPIPL